MKKRIKCGICGRSTTVARALSRNSGWVVFEDGQACCSKCGDQIDRAKERIKRYPLN